ncbi:ATP-binding cassette domain-containing protein [Myxococcota bacterium]|nr:ATP-binding cassette domain-containing protein [Myxococcota bacterium]
MTTSLLPPLSGPLVARGLIARAGGHTLLDGVGLTLHPGELCGLIGPSGAGKSTLIRCLLGLRAPDGGEVSLAGAPPRAEGVGYVPQQDAIHRALTPRQALDFAARLRRPELGEAARAARVEALAKDVGLEERLDTRIFKLSGGQQKRVSVALELLTEPGLLILDEPTSGLDPGLESRLMELLRRLARQGRAVLVATHATASLPMCDALLVLVAGRVAYFGPPDEALAFFKAERFGDIFTRLPLRSPEAWAKAHLQDPQRAGFLARSAPLVGQPNNERPATPTRSAPPAAPPTEKAAAPPLSAAEQLAALKAQRKGGPP